MRKIREFIQSAHTLTSDAMRSQFARDGRDDEDLESRADVGARIGILGLGAAATTIFGALALSSQTAPLLIGFGLSTTALMGLHWLKTATNIQFPYLAVSGTWIAGLAYLASIHPFSASVALAASLAIIGRARTFRTRCKKDAVEPEAVAIDKIDHPVEEAAFLLDRAGYLKSKTPLGNLNLTTGEMLADRVHLADRVQFLHALSQLRAGELPCFHLHLRINTADNGHAAFFEDFDIEMIMCGDAVELRQSLVSDAGRHDAQVEEEPNSDRRFLAIVSHELRTPLNAIIGFSEVLRSDLNGDLSDGTRSEYIDLIHGAGSHLLSLVNTILDVSKIESGTYSIDRDEFDFPQTARECMAMLGGQAKQKNVVVNDRITCPVGLVNGDRRAIKQILINLLSNSIKYTEPKGFVTIDAQVNDAGLVLEVSDTGIGMGPDDLEMIAKPFAQVDNSITRKNEGTGLGLALVKGLVELHGGKLEISSKLGVGTKVKVHIPNEPELGRNDALSELNPAREQSRRISESMSELQTFPRKEIGHGTRKAG